MTAFPESALSRLLYALVPLEVRGPDWSGVGTTFLYTSTQPEGTVPVLVANRSLVERAEAGHFYFTRAEGGRAILGEHIGCELEEAATLWHPHPDPAIDLAVAAFGPIPSQLERAGRSAYVSSLDRTLVANVTDRDVDAIEEVFVLGFVAGLQDRAHILPLTQRGITSSPFQVDYDGRRAFVVQVPVYPGLGGSPVIVVRQENRIGSGSIERVTQVRLLGVLSQVAEWGQGSMSFVPIPPAPPPAGAAWVPFALAIRAETIEEAVDDLLRTHLPDTAAAPTFRTGESAPSTFANTVVGS